MSIANFFLRQLMKSKMKDVPAAEQERIFSILEKNPDFFKKIAEEVQAKIKSGKDQQSAVMEVLTANQEELKKVMS